MTVTRHGTGALPGNPPLVRKTYIPGVGQTQVGEWRMDKALTEAKYTEVVNASEGGANIARIEHTNDQGRGTLVVSYGREVTSQYPDLGYGADVSVTEELYDSEVLIDLSQAPYFSQTLDNDHRLYALQSGKDLPLTDEQVAFVRLCVEERFNHSEITAEATTRGYSASYAFASWTTGMLEYHYLLTHGVETHPMNAFIFRRTVYGVRKTIVGESLAGINYVVSTPPVMLTEMQTWVDALPTGEWIYNCPRIQSVTGGKRTLDLEWQYAEKWPINLGGTFNYTAP